MSEGAEPDHVAIFAPLAADAAALAGALEGCGHRARVRDDLPALAASLAPEVMDSMLALIVAEEGAGPREGRLLAEALAAQPEWSSLPVLFLVGDATRPPPAFRLLRDGGAPAQVVLLERPIRPAVLAGVIATQSALRRRQLEARDLLARLAEAEKRQSFLLNEVRHRTRNTLAVLQALFRLTARNYPGVEDFVGAFASRLRSLSDAHVRLAEEGAGSDRLHDIFRQHAAPYCTTSGQLDIHGPDLRATGALAFELSMAANELATNAAKYGALSVAEGKVSVAWADLGDGQGVELVWCEQGGPPVGEPGERRLGSQLIGTVGRDVGARSSTEFRRDGLVWTLRVPADCLEPVSASGRPD
jgi:two-component sensor histidine kinase